MTCATRIPPILALLAAGCFVDLPGEDGSESSSLVATSTSEGTTLSEGDGTSEGRTTSATASETTSGTTAGEASTGTSTGSTSLEPMTSPGTTLATTSGTTSSSTSEGSTTMSPQPNPLEIPASIAACVLLESGPYTYLGPDACSEAATALNGTDAEGVLALDAQLLVAMGRPAQIYLRFPLPPLLDGVTITNAEVSMVLADGRPAGGTIGDLHRVSSFSMESLASAAPSTKDLLQPDPEILYEAGSTVVRTLPPAIIDEALEQGHLHLGLLPTSSDNTFFHGTQSGGALLPSLTITYE